MAQLREKIVHAADGTALYVADWLVRGRAPHGGLVLMHGLGEHVGRYAHVVKFFTDCGLSVRTYDHRGHGKSDGGRGDIPNGEPILQDAQIVLDDFAEELGCAPVLLGHSMGGLFALRFALEQRAPLRALILSSPALAVQMAPWQHWLLNCMRRLAPGFGLPNHLPVKYLTHDQSIVQAYRHDKLVHGRISARLMLRILDGIRYCQQHAGELRVPLYLMVAGADKLVDPEGSYRLYPKLPRQLATMQIYPELYHEIFNELQSDQVFNNLREWLLAQGIVKEYDFAGEVE